MIKTLHRWYDKLRKPLLKPASRQKPVKWRCFTIEDRKITPPMSCEVNAVDHCNIACLDCNHAAPALPESYADPGSVHRDLARLAKVYKAGCLKILGGEPLLHPDLLSLVQAARASRISQTIRLITNGTLLHRMPDTIWSSIDELELSHYPEPELKEHHLRTIEKKSQGTQRSPHSLLLPLLSYYLLNDRHAKRKPGPPDLPNLQTCQALGLPVHLPGLFL